jgi:hypothetical protein
MTDQRWQWRRQLAWGSGKRSNILHCGCVQCRHRLGPVHVICGLCQRELNGLQSEPRHVGHRQLARFPGRVGELSFSGRAHWQRSVERDHRPAEIETDRYRGAAGWVATSAGIGTPVGRYNIAVAAVGRARWRRLLTFGDGYLVRGCTNQRVSVPEASRSTIAMAAPHVVAVAAKDVRDG